MVLSAQSTTEDYIRAKRKTQFISWEFIKQIVKHQFQSKRNKCIYENHMFLSKKKKKKKKRKKEENEAEKTSRRTEKMHQEEEREKKQTNKTKQNKTKKKERKETDVNSLVVSCNLPHLV